MKGEIGLPFRSWENFLDLRHVLNPPQTGISQSDGVSSPLYRGNIEKATEALKRIDLEMRRERGQLQ